MVAFVKPQRESPARSMRACPKSTLPLLTCFEDGLKRPVQATSEPFPIFYSMLAMCRKIACCLAPTVAKGVGEAERLLFIAHRVSCSTLKSTSPLMSCVCVNVLPVMIYEATRI